jgi:hypothetical protein
MRLTIWLFALIGLTLIHVLSADPLASSALSSDRKAKGIQANLVARLRRQTEEPEDKSDEEEDESDDSKAKLKDNSEDEGGKSEEMKAASESDKDSAESSRAESNDSSASSTEEPPRTEKPKTSKKVNWVDIENEWNDVMDDDLVRQKWNTLDEKMKAGS